MSTSTRIEYRKIDDTTVEKVTAIKWDPLFRKEAVQTISRLFNFAAAEVLTTVSLIVSPDYSNHDTLAAQSRIDVRDFNDFARNDEIRAAHAELLNLGGKPPALDELFPPRVLKKTEAPADTRG